MKRQGRRGKEWVRVRKGAEGINQSINQSINRNLYSGSYK